MKDMKNRFSTKQSLNPAGNRGNGAQNGAGVDLTGYEGARVDFSVGTITDGTHTPKLQESSDSTNGTDGTWTDVAAADQEGTLANLAASTPQSVGYKGSKRWVRAVVTGAGATTGAMYAANVIRGFARHNPAA